MPWNNPWGRGDPLPTTLSAALDDLDRLVGERPELANPGRQLGRVLRATFEVAPAEVIAVVAPASSWAEGVAAFRAAPPMLDGETLARRAQAICAVLRSENSAAPALLSALRRRRVDLREWWRAALDGRPEEIAAEVEALGLDPALALSVLRLSLLPALARFAEALDRERPEGLWERGDCPCCGSAPALAESRGLEQRRFLRCGLCASQWPCDRLRCASCGESDHRALYYRYVEREQDRFRRAHCDTCGSHLKVASTLVPLSPPGLLVLELATIHLDLIP